MTSEATIAIAVLIGSGILVVGVQALPPLNSWEASTTRTSGPQRDVLDGAPDELAYCQTRLSGVNCACFADTASQILRKERPRAQGWAYADPMQLALNQTADRCR